MKVIKSFAQIFKFFIFILLCSVSETIAAYGFRFLIQSVQDCSSLDILSLKPKDIVSIINYNFYSVYSAFENCYVKLIAKFCHKFLLKVHKKFIVCSIYMCNLMCYVKSGQN